MTTQGPTASQPRAENLWLNLGFNVVLPFLVLSKLSGSQPWRPFGGVVEIPALGPLGGLLVALSFPLMYGVYDLARRRRWNVLSIIGLSGVLLSGGLGLLRLDPFWFAVKEAAVPLVIGAVIVGSLATKRPLVRAFLLNPDLVDTDKLQNAVASRQAEKDFDQLLVRSTWWLGGMFVISAILNFTIARLLVKSPPQTEAFNQELAAMNLWSLAGIMVPMMIGMGFLLWSTFKGIHALTGLTADDLFRSPPAK